MSAERFLRLWTPFEDVLALELLRRGKEITLISKLIPTPRAAMLAIDQMAASPEPVVREGAASVAGFFPEHAPLDTLQRLFTREADADLSEPMNAVNAQENVRAIVFSAARWCRSDRARDAGLATCRTIVERTIDGGAREHWTSSPYAMATLVKHAPDAHRALLDRYAQWANGEPPAYVVPTTLQAERSCARALLSSNENALGRVDAMLDARDAEGMVAIPARMREALDEMLAAAREVG